MALLAGAGVGDAEVAVGAGVFGGVSKATLSHLFGSGLYTPGMAAGVSLGAVAAAAGALSAKTWAETFDGSHATRLAEVRSHARLSASPDTALGPAMRQLLTSFNWCLSVEERRRGGLSGSAAPLNLAPFFGGKDESGDGDVSVGSTQRSVDKEMRRQVRRIWKLCDHPPPRSPPKHRAAKAATHSFSQKSFFKEAIKSQSKSEESWRDSNPETYNKLFNPQYDSVTDDRGLCAALCYLVGSFIRHRKSAPGAHQDGSRASLRLAVAALARHPVFDEEVLDKDDGSSDDITEFRRGALALIPLLDAALAWRPVDPWGWFGTCEDDAPLLVAHMKGICSFPALAARLKKSLNKAASGDNITWRRLSVHLDAVRVRDLPAPWSWIWLQAQDSSMLVRNHTKVALRVELHRPASSKVSPWSDWPLLQRIADTFVASDKQRPLIVAQVEPGIEWAMRPRACEGRHFEMKLVTEHGVVVSSKKLRRGQTFDFKVNVPERKRSLARRALSCLPAKAIGKDMDGDDESVCSTAVPSQSGRMSIASTASASTTATSAITADAPVVCSARSKPMQGIEETPPLICAETLEAAICPRCLREMRSRSTRPTAATYAQGVECDRCSEKLLEVECARESNEGNVEFFHCKRCWYDLCRSCALREMQDVWWGED